MKKCVTCGGEIQEGWRYCPQCGTLTKTVEDIIREEVRKAEIRVLNLTFQLYADKELREMAYLLSKLDDKQRSIVNVSLSKLENGVPSQQVWAEAQAEIAKLNIERANHRT